MFVKFCKEFEPRPKITTRDFKFVSEIFAGFNSHEVKFVREGFGVHVWGYQ